MKVTETPKKKEFQPVEITVTFESLKELELLADTLGRASHSTKLWSTVRDAHNKAK